VSRPTLLGYPVVVTDDAPKLEGIVFGRPGGPRIVIADLPPDACDRCGKAEPLEQSRTIRHEGEWLCHGCERDARMEE